MTKTIVLIHGAWLNAKSWENWKTYFEAKGFVVVAPNWPYNEREPAELRAKPHPELRKVGFLSILESLDRVHDEGQLRKTEARAFQNRVAHLP